MLHLAALHSLALYRTDPRPTGFLNNNLEDEIYHILNICFIISLHCEGFDIHCHLMWQCYPFFKSATGQMMISDDTEVL